MIGFLFGIAIAFFVAGPAMLLGKALEQAGMPVGGTAVLWALDGLYAVLILAAAVQIWRRLQHHEAEPGAIGRPAAGASSRAAFDCLALGKRDAERLAVRSGRRLRELARWPGSLSWARGGR
ncbi:MAG: hypothetical protein E5W57_13945 [Mesorhizobium sp.]|nr:MAG: hypothetical protein E5W57_13945 [Mesorhizobium sp.]